MGDGIFYPHPLFFLSKFLSKVNWSEIFFNGYVNDIFSSRKLITVLYISVKMISVSYEILDLCQYRGGFICKMLSILFVYRPVHMVCMYWWNLRLKKTPFLIGKKLLKLTRGMFKEITCPNLIKTPDKKILWPKIFVFYVFIIIGSLQVVMVKEGQSYLNFVKKIMFIIRCCT